MHRREFIWRSVAVAAAASWLQSWRAAGQGSSHTFYQGPGTRRMAAILAKIADEADANPQDNPFWNHKRAEALRSFLAQHKLDSERELELRMSLAQELLYAGQTEEAISEFESLFKQLIPTIMMAGQTFIWARARRIWRCSSPIGCFATWRESSSRM